jgi:hypothetical protein
MRKETLTLAVESAKTETKTALQTVYDSLNHGQQKKIVKDEKVKALFDLYGVEYEEEIENV